MPVPVRPPCSFQGSRFQHHLVTRRGDLRGHEQRPAGQVPRLPPPRPSSRCWSRPRLRVVPDAVYSISICLKLRIRVDSGYLDDGEVEACQDLSIGTAAGSWLLALSFPEQSMMAAPVRLTQLPFINARVGHLQTPAGSFPALAWWWTPSVDTPR
jgi:hypothetical protein